MSLGELGEDGIVTLRGLAISASTGNGIYLLLPAPDDPAVIACLLTCSFTSFLDELGIKGF